jgi:hypothetical protein
MSTGIDLTEIRDRLRRAKATQEPRDAADQWAMLGGDVPALVDEIVRLRTALATAEREREEAQRIATSEMGIAEKAQDELEDISEALAPLDSGGGFAFQVRQLVEAHSRLRGVVERIADECGLRAVQRAGTTDASARVAFTIYDKIATELRAALGSTPDTPEAERADPTG